MTRYAKMPYKEKNSLVLLYLSTLKKLELGCGNNISYEERLVTPLSHQVEQSSQSQLLVRISASFKVFKIALEGSK